MTGNLNPIGAYPITGNLNPFGDFWGAALGLVGSLIGGGSGGGGGGNGMPQVVTINEPPPQPAPPVPFNWTPVIVSGGVTLIALTLIMTSGRKH